MVEEEKKKVEEDPQGFTCGVCGLVVPYNKELKCSNCEGQKKEVE